MEVPPPLISLIGAGGLGHPVSWVLASAGIPLQLQIVDSDVVERSNLNRQIFFSETDLGQPKAPLLAQRISERFRLSEPSARITRLDSTNVSEVLAGCDIVIDATDSIETKFLLNDWCVQNLVPFIYAGVVAVRGLAMAIIPGGPCLRCVFESGEGEEENCQTAGIVGAAAGVVGALQGELALKALSTAPLTPLLYRLGPNGLTSHF